MRIDGEWLDSSVLCCCNNKLPVRLSSSLDTDKGAGCPIDTEMSVDPIDHLDNGSMVEIVMSFVCILVLLCTLGCEMHLSRDPSHRKNENKLLS